MTSEWKRLTELPEKRSGLSFTIREVTVSPATCSITPHVHIQGELGSFIMCYSFYLSLLKTVYMSVSYMNCYLACFWYVYTHISYHRICIIHEGKVIWLLLFSIINIRLSQSLRMSLIKAWTYSARFSIHIRWNFQIHKWTENSLSDWWNRSAEAMKQHQPQPAPKPLFTAA